MNQNIHSWATRWNVPAAAIHELLDLVDPTRTMTPGDSTSEAALSAELSVLAPKHGASLWRNNNGSALMVNPNRPDEQPRHVRFGLGNASKKLSEVWKSSDRIGITPMVSTAAGQWFGVFTAVEVKKPGWTKPKNKRELGQSNFLGTVRSMGGIGIFAQSAADYEGIFK
jgi:hypothetical protein